MYLCMYFCMYVYVCMFVYMYVCMYVCTSIEGRSPVALTDTTPSSQSCYLGFEFGWILGSLLAQRLYKCIVL